VENTFIESFNASLRKECLNVHWFQTLEEARLKIEQWRKEYNEDRPHGSLGYITPACFRAGWSRKDDPAGARKRG
jgi:putative transposase